MMPKKSYVAAGAVLCVLAAGALGSDWVDINDPKELSELYSNKTFRGNGWSGHYRADGKGVIIVQSTGKRMPRTWQVKGNDQVCVTLESGSTSCSRFQRHRTNRDQIVITNVKDGMTFNATVEEGVPSF